jgi:hypothetical protein
MEPATTAMLVSASISVGTKLFDYFSGKSAARKAKKQLQDKTASIMQGKIGVGEAFEGELENISERTDKAQSRLSRMGASQLEGTKLQLADRKSTFAGSGREDRAIQKSEKSIWDDYLDKSEDILMAEEDKKIGAYGRLVSGVGQVESSYENIMSDIESLGV